MARIKLSLKGRALRYLSAREHSRLELRRKLLRYAEEGDDVDAVLDMLESAKLLSQERFTESLVHRRMARFGNNRILSELQQHGLQDDLIAQARQDLTQDEDARAIAVWRRKFVAAPSSSEERARQMRFLAQRGFSGSAIRAVFRWVRDEGFQHETDGEVRGAEECFDEECSEERPKKHPEEGRRGKERGPDSDED